MSLRLFPARLALPLALSLLAGSALAAARSPLAGTGTLEKVMKKVSEQQKKTTSLQADFRQEKVLALLAKPEVSSGTFAYAKPNRVLWKYENPKPVVMLIAQGALTTYYPALKKAERLEVRRFEDRIFKYMGAGGAIDELARYFDFTFIENKRDPFYTLELNPNTKVVARRVRRIKIWIDRERYLTTKIEYVEGDGDITRYEFSNIRVNEKIPDSQFTLQLPAGVRVEKLSLE